MFRNAQKLSFCGAVCRRGLLISGALTLTAMAPPGTQTQALPPSPTQPDRSGLERKTTEDYNRRLEQLRQLLEPHVSATPGNEYQIGPEDLLEISVFEASELNRSLRVSAGGEISLPLLGTVQAAGLTPRELESVLQEVLRRRYMKDPHVGVFVREMQSHPVSVFGAVRKPGVFQIRGNKTLVEVLSMAEGLAEDAGDTVLVMHDASFPPSMLTNPSSRTSSRAASSGPQQSGPPAATPAAADKPAHRTIEIDLKRLLDSGDPLSNVTVYPGDVVKVPRAGIVYVVGEVRKPGGYLLKSNENISVLQALALAEGLTRTSQKRRARIIRTDENTGARSEIAIDVGKILAGKAADPVLRARDIVFIPNSAARSGLYRGGEAAISIVSGLLVFRR